MCVGLPFFQGIKPLLKEVVLDLQVQIPVHYGPMLLLDCPVCKMLATTPPC